MSQIYNDYPMEDNTMQDRRSCESDSEEIIDNSKATYQSEEEEKIFSDYFNQVNKVKKLNSSNGSMIGSI